MKILLFSPFYPPHIGGLESHSDEFNRHLSQKGVEIYVFTPRLPDTAPATETPYPGVKILRFPAFELFHNYPLPKFWLKTFWQQWDILLSDNFDFILSRTRFFFTSLMAWYYSKKYSLPWVHIEHGSDFAQFNGRIKTGLGKLYDWIFGRLILRSADVVIGNSQASARFVKKLSGRDDCYVIYRGANVMEIESIKPNKEIQEKYRGKTIVAFSGRLIDGKGVSDLVRALAQLKRSDIIAFIIGDGPEKEYLLRLVSRSQLNDQVIFFGNLPFTSAICLLKTAHIVVNPSYTEGLPTAVTEAALCRKAIIATDVGGTREIISGKNDGYLFPPKSISALKEKLLDLIDHPEKRGVFGKNAYEEVRNKFSWDEASTKYREIFEELLKK